MAAIKNLLMALAEGHEDIEDAYTGRKKVAATRARKALMTVKKAAHEARQELLAIRKGEMEPVKLEFDVLLDASLDDHV